ncbi:hypothetical protein, partial [uncultured Thiocystis sp.]|uniref:hypothetical protein n=1 Tax=uncultured Thiocystis sp. TaxID=1202134 RepID=UPI0025F8DA3E
ASIIVWSTWERGRLARLASQRPALPGTANMDQTMIDARRFTHISRLKMSGQRLRCSMSMRHELVTLIFKALEIERN